ncbi:MAG: hypothetical protein HY670_02940 [Chloroflexi bacterium]|nr:hypothetical protein [Chloroflexota bacterium]
MAIATGELLVPKTQKAKRYAYWGMKGRALWPSQKIIADCFRLAAFSAAILQIVAFPNGPGYSAFPDFFIGWSKIHPSVSGYQVSWMLVLVVAAGLYSVLKIAQPFRWQQIRTVNISLLLVDMAVCVLLVNLSGGIHSPFILYTLLPVLTAALLRDYTVTIFVSVVTAVYVLAGNIYNAASNYILTLQAVNDFFVYVIALGLVAALPYTFNLELGKRLQSMATMVERRRIAHELHDSVCQTLCGLRWQIQRLSQRMPVDDRLSAELKRIEASVITAENDARSLLEVLGMFGASDGFLATIKYDLEQLRHCAGINYQLKCKATDFELPESVGYELLMICKEALANIKKHAEARNVLFFVRRTNGHLQIRLTDDGRGFNASGESPPNHGLSIMRERSEAIGATMRITSAVGKGTEIEVELPG